MLAAQSTRPRGEPGSRAGKSTGGRELLSRLRRSAPGLYAVLSARASMLDKSLENLNPEELAELASQVSPSLARLLAEAA